MAAINFVKGEQYYTAEFQINGPVNVHIERAEAGALYFRQRSIDHGSYDLINGANWNNRGDLTIDTAIQGVVYPMWIKIESASEPTLAEMVEGEQSGGGAGTAEYVNDIVTEYWAIDWDKAEELGYNNSDTSVSSFAYTIRTALSFAPLSVLKMNGTVMSIGPTGVIVGALMENYISCIAFAKTRAFDTTDEGSNWLDYNSFEEVLARSLKPEIAEVFYKITKEEFYQGVEEA